MRKSFLAAALLLLAAIATAQAPVISFQSYITGLSAPVDVINAGDGSNRLLIVEQGGKIRLWNGTALSDFINLGSIISTGGEQGLLSAAFHPQYDGTTNRYFFVYYTDLSGNLALSRYQTAAGNPSLGDPASAQLILTIPHPSQSNHNGGKLLFGTDGHLYFATGDGGGGGDVPNNAQNGSVLLGKMLRINVDAFTTPPYYTVPASNPYTADAAVDDRVFALGLRNPFRWSFDRANGNIWIGDVGQDGWEEVNMRTAAQAALGTNYGWRCYEGTQPYNTAGCGPAGSYTAPVFEYPNPSPGAAAITGGFVYRGPDYPAFRGYYIAADVYSGNIYLVWPDGGGGWNSATQPAVQAGIAGFGEGEDGTLYAAALNGTVYRVVATGGTPLPVRLTHFSAGAGTGVNRLRWHTAAEENIAQFHVEYSSNGNNFSRAGSVAAQGQASGSAYRFDHPATSPQAFYRLSIEEVNGSLTYSNILRLQREGRGILLQPAFVRDQKITIEIYEPATALRLFSTSGQLLWTAGLRGAQGAQILRLPQLQRGLYIARVDAASGPVAFRIFIE